MTRKILYVLNIPTGSQTVSRKQLRGNISKHGAIAGGNASVESVSVNPGSRVLRGEYRGELADVMAREVEELFGCGGIEYVPMFGVDEDGNRVETDFEGYYALENVSDEPADPRDDSKGHYKFDGEIVDKGTKRDYWRAVRTSPRDVETSFGNSTTGLIGIPATATKLRWVDTRGGSRAREDPSIEATRDTEFGQIELIDATSVSFSRPTAVYEIPYEAEGRTDTKVWDDRGVSKTKTVDGDDVCQWARVFDTAHEYSGTPVIENAILRLAFDESSGDLVASRWDQDASEYQGVTLGTSDWELFDLDLFEIGDERIRGQIEFYDPSEGAFYSLDMTLHRGYENAQWIVPENEEPPTPDGLQAFLDPIAEGSVVSPNETKTLEERSGVRK